MRRSGLRVLVCAIAVAVGVAPACTDRRLDEASTDSSTDPAAPTTASAPGASAAPAAGASTTLIPGVDLTGVDTADLRLGAAFNRQFLAVQFLFVGLERTEAECAAGKVADAGGDTFGRSSVSELTSTIGTGVTPDLLVGCMTTERLMALAQTTDRPPLDAEAAGIVRSTLTELASAGYEAAGLTATEANCLAERVMGSYADDELLQLVTSAGGPDRADAAAVAACAPR